MTSTLNTYRDSRQFLWWGGLVGFCVPVFWGALSFVLFNAKQSPWTDAYWHLVYTTCPPWLLNIPSLLVPVLNAALYVLLVSVFLIGKQLLRRRFDAESGR
jgi:hypothetical protein